MYKIETERGDLFDVNMMIAMQTGYQMSRGKTKKFRSEKKCMLTLTLQDAKPA